MRIGLDIDGVLGRFNKNFNVILSKFNGMDVIGEEIDDPSFSDIWDWDRDRYPPEVVEAAWDYINHHPMFWMGLDPLPGMKIAKDIDTGVHDLYFITNRPGAGVQLVTHHWLEEMGVMAPNVIVNKRKGLIAAALELDVYVDDNLDNVLDCQHTAPGVRTYCLDYPHNQDREGPYGQAARRRKSVEEIFSEEGLIGR